MKVLSFLIRCNIRKSLIVAVLSVISGLGSAGLIAVVNSTLQVGHNGAHWEAWLAVAFIVTLVGKIAGGVISNLLLGKLAQESILKLCTQLCRKIAGTPLRELEKMGSSRVLTCLTEDVNVLSGATQAVSLILINSVVLAGCGAYLASMAWSAVFVLALVMGTAAFCYRILVHRASHAVRSARLGKETLFRHFRSLTDGIKELKIHRGRREAFFQEELDAAAEYYRGQNVIALNQYALADAWSQIMFGILLATLLFLLPVASRISREDLVKYVLVAIYVMSPAWNLIRALPTFAAGEASLNRMRELGLMLDNLGPSVIAPTAPEPTAPEPPTIEFRDVTFSYGNDGNDGFRLGPLNWTFHPGELVLVIGGNGSGKSSFVKLLTGLYTPDTGEIILNGKPVHGVVAEDYRQLFSVVYSDYFLFDRILGMAAVDLERRARRYLTALDLSNKIKFEGNSFSTTNVSQGQRRRLALLAAYLEDRPIYVLDEWAADQDPAFRQVFYHQILPELKSRGKTVVVVTHDDRYFDIGDRIIKLEYGTMVETFQTSAPASIGGTR